MDGKIIAGAVVGLLVVAGGVYCFKSGTPQPAAPKQMEQLRQAHASHLERIRTLDEKKRKSLQALHYVSWVTALANAANYPDNEFDKAVLELEFNHLTDDDYNFEYLDENTRNHITSLIKRLNNLRIDSAKRDFIKEIYEQDKKDAFFSCLPANMAVIIDLNWKQLVANTVQTALYSYMNYRKIQSALQKKFQTDIFRLDMDEMENFTRYAVSNLDELFRICQAAQLTAEDRTMMNDVNELAKKVKEFDLRREDYRRAKQENIQRIHLKKILFSWEERFKNFPMYWYYRGIYSYDSENPDANDLKEAEYCFDVYQELCRFPIKSYDPVAADVAKRQILIEMSLNEKSNVDIDKIKMQLQIVRSNTKINESEEQNWIFCGVIYAAVLNDWHLAAEMFAKAQNSSVNEKLKKFNNGISGLISIPPVDPDYPFQGLRYEKQNTSFRLPAADTTFFAQMAEYYCRIQDKDDDTVLSSIAIKAMDDQTPPWEILFYAAYVKERATKAQYYERILPLALEVPNGRIDCSPFYAAHPDWAEKPVGFYPLPYEIKYLDFANRWGKKDLVILDFPLKYALLQEVQYHLELRANSQRQGEPLNASVIRLYRGKNGEIRIGLGFPCEGDLLPGMKIDAFRFKAEHKLFRAVIDYPLTQELKKRNAQKEYYRSLSGTMRIEFTEDGQRLLQNRIKSGDFIK